MSAFDTTVAQMTAEHALWAVNIKIVLARLTLRFHRAKVLRDHKTIIERRQPQLGKGARPKRKMPDPPVLLEMQP